MLRREHHRVQMHGLAVLVVLHRNLGFAVRTKIRKGSVLAYLGKLSRELVREADRVRHQLGGLVRRIAEHHTLVAGAYVGVLHAAARIRGARLLCLQRLVDAHGNVRRLLIERDNDAAGVGVKSVFGARVSDLADRVTHGLLNVHIGFGRNLAHHKHQSGRDRRLAGDTAHRILRDHRVKHRVRNLVADLIGMPFGH